MSYNTIKLRPNDILFSKYIREKSNWTCEYCKRKCRINGEVIYRLEASHYYGRRKESVRFDEENVHSLCATCHKELGGYQNNQLGKYDLWMKEKLGEKGYKLLLLRANQTGKRDDKMTKIIIQQLMKDLYWTRKIKTI